MSLFDIIEHAQQRPRRSRKKIFTATLVTIMGIIVVFWLSTLGVGMFRPFPDTPGPVAVFSTPFVALYGRIKALLRSDNATIIYDVYENQR